MGLPDDTHASEFKVIQTGEDQFYIGTMFQYCGEESCNVCSAYLGFRKYNKGDELDYNSRETEYFDSKKEANAALAEYFQTGELDKQRR